MPNLHSNRLLVCAALLVSSTFAQAQTHRVAAPEKVVRAVGVYEWTGDLAKPAASRLIPVTVFIDGAFQDGGTYYARPVPLALLNGNVYSLEKAGLPQGNVTLDYARHLQTAAAGTDDTIDIGWFGYGDYTPLPAAPKAPALRASSNPPVIVGSKDNDRPTFVRHNTDTKATPAADNKTPDPAPSAPDDPDRPHFSKAPAPATTPAPDATPAASTPAPDSAAPATPAAKTPATSTRNQTDPADDADRPTLRHRDPKLAEAERKARETSGVRDMPTSLNDDPNRPLMKRGKTPGIASAAPQLTGLPAGLHQMAAVSDAVTRPPHPFAREWATPTERAEVLARLQAIAQQQLADYARTNTATMAPPPAPAKPAPKTSARTRRPEPKPAAAVAVPLTAEDITAYTLSYGGLPTFVYTAINPSAPASTLPEQYVTLVAQQLPSGELQVAFSSVTDAAHLDRTPWFRLVDAVDPDAGHRASLLFELRGHSSRQFALYRILTAKAEPLFVTNSTN